MSGIICPVCDTPNEVDAAFCEACGERLQSISDEEIEAESNEIAAQLDAEETADSEAEETGDEAAEPAGMEVEEEEPSADLAPSVLYSPLDGSAYPEGTPEFEDGFGPNGEELVATAPDLAEESEEASEPSAEYAQEEPSDDFVQEADALDDASAPSPAFQAAFSGRSKSTASVAVLPAPGPLAEPATLTLYVNREPVATFPIDTDELLMGRRDPVADAYPDIEFSEFDPDSLVSRKHAYVYRQNRNYTLYVVSNAGTQLNSDLLSLGDKRALTDGDVIVLSGKFALKFELPA